MTPNLIRPGLPRECSDLDPQLQRIVSLVEITWHAAVVATLAHIHLNEPPPDEAKVLYVENMLKERR